MAFPNINARYMGEVCKVGVLIYAFVWFSFIINHSSNIPIMDDYDSILGFLMDFRRAEWVDKIRRILRPHNEHPLLFSNLVVLFNYYVFGKVNFVYLVIVGNSLLLLMFWMFVRDARQKGFEWGGLILVGLFLNLCAATILIWPMTALQHSSSIFLAFLSMKMFCSDELGYWQKLFRYPLLYLAAFSGGANILIVPIIAIGLFFKSNKSVLLYFVINAIVIGVLRLLIHPASAPLSGDRSVIHIIKFVLLFLGNPLNSRWSYLLGVFVVGLMVVAIFRQYHRRFPIYFYNALFICLVGLAASASRLDYGVEYALEPKYTVYTLSCLASLLMMFMCGIFCESSIRVWQRYCIVALIFLFSTGVCVRSWHINKKPISELAEINWIIYPIAETKRAEDVLLRAQQDKIYMGERYIVNYPKK